MNNTVPILVLAGNPNCGKTSIFNALTGSKHHVGNWAGVTVERTSAFLVEDGREFEIVDLPGSYSLQARSEDERIAASFLASSSVDLIINVLDSSNLERNLYLTSQLIELDRPIIFVLNMMDEAEKSGLKIQLSLFSQLLGGPVIPTVGNRAEGIQALRASIAESATFESYSPVKVNFGKDIEGEIPKIQTELARDEELAKQISSRWLALQLLEGSPEAIQLAETSHARKAIAGQVEASKTFLEKHLGDDISTLLAEKRYGFVHGLVRESIQDSPSKRNTLTEKIDAFLTHRWLGIPLLFVILAGVYGITFLLGKYPQLWIDQVFALLRQFLAHRLPPGEFTSLLTDGILPGVGSVVVFVPMIMLLMGCIAFLEDTGYLARAAFIMDRLMHWMGLHGKSFIPLLMGTGCNVPAIQATRTLEAKADRLITILVSPLISCSARLQVYILIAGAFFPPLQAAMAILGLHFLGFLLAMLMGKLLRLTLFKRESAPFVMELPPYRLPVLKSTLLHMWEKGRVFLSRAGTVILAGATLIWFLSHYPGIANSEWRATRLQQEGHVIQMKHPKNEEDRLLSEIHLAYEQRIMNSSLAATFGKLMEKPLRPLLDPERKRKELWKDGVALTAGFVAKEIVVGTLGVMYQAPSENTQKATLQEALQIHSGLTPLTALAFMVFTLFYTPCLGAVSIIFKETRSLGWTVFTIAYGLGLAWFLSFVVIRIGYLLGFSP